MADGQQYNPIGGGAPPQQQSQQVAGGYQQQAAGYGYEAQQGRPGDFQQPPPQAAPAGGGFNAQQGGQYQQSAAPATAQQGMNGQSGEQGQGEPYGEGARGPGTGRRFDNELTPGKLFIGGLDQRTTKESLVDYCGKWGELIDSVIMPGRGFGFVTFSDSAAADSFLEHKEHIIDGKSIEAKLAVPRNGAGGGSYSGGGRGGPAPGGFGGRGQQGPALGNKIFVGGTGEVSDEEFHSHFEKYGEIEDACVVRNPQGVSRGFGFVTYKNYSSVDRCFQLDHILRGRKVELKRAVPKDQMGGRGMAGGQGGMKETDWKCLSCGNINFGWRDKCNRCSDDRPPGMGMPRGGGGRGGGMGMMGGGGMGGMGGFGMQGMGMMGGYNGMPMAMGYGNMGGMQPSMMGGYGMMGGGMQGPMAGMGGPMGGMGGMGGMQGGAMGGEMGGPMGGGMEGGYGMGGMGAGGYGMGDGGMGGYGMQQGDYNFQGGGGFGGGGYGGGGGAGYGRAQGNSGGRGGSQRYRPY